MWCRRMMFTCSSSGRSMTLFVWSAQLAPPADRRAVAPPSQAARYAWSPTQSLAAPRHSRRRACMSNSIRSATLKRIIAKHSFTFSHASSSSSLSFRRPKRNFLLLNAIKKSLFVGFNPTLKAQQAVTNSLRKKNEIRSWWASRRWKTFSMFRLSIVVAFYHHQRSDKQE